LSLLLPFLWRPWRPWRPWRLLRLWRAGLLGGWLSCLVGPLVGVQTVSAAPAPSATAPQTIVFWTMQLSPFHDDFVNDLIQKFEAQHPGAKVRWVDVPWAEMERKALASMAAGTAADVLNLNPQFAARLAELGALADPQRHLSAAQVAAYLPSAWAANQLAGTTFAVPWYLSTTVTLYHRDVLAKAGVQVPSNFNQLQAAAAAIRQRTGSYAWFPALDGAAPLETLVAMTGALLTDDACRPAFEGAAGAAYFAFFRDLYQQQHIPPTVLTEGHRSAVTQFLAGQVAMVSTGMQFLAQVRSNNPGLYAQMGVAPQVTGWRAAVDAAPTTALGSGTPVISFSNNTRPNIAAMNLAVPTSSRNPALAFAFAAFVTNAENQLALVKRVPLLPSSRDSYNDAWFTQPTGDRLLDEARAISIKQVFEGVVQVPPLRHYNKLRTSFIRQMQAAMVGRITAQAAVDEITRTWVPLLGCAPDKAPGRAP
jgi:putative chitobiose transport system substrate-binding protein